MIIQLKYTHHDEFTQVKVLEIVNNLSKIE